MSDLTKHADRFNGYVPESKEEMKFLLQYDPKKFPVITHTVDMVVLGVDYNDAHVLLIERGNYPYRGRWALPGGFIEPWETTLEAATRELREEAGLNVPTPKYLMLADDPKRDPRGRCLSSVYKTVVLGTPTVYAGDDARNAKWWSVEEAVELDLAFDHSMILKKALVAS